jgi:hypothetical protein
MQLRESSTVRAYGIVQYGRLAQSNRNELVPQAGGRELGVRDDR